MRLRAIAIALSASVLLASCASRGGMPPASSGNELRTASDQTDADRRAAVRMELAALHYGRGQYETALDEIKLALQAKPDLGAAFGLRALVYGSMGEDALAEESFSRALQINPRDADAMHNRAWFLCQKGKFVEGDRWFEQALAVPQYRDAQRSLMAQGVCHGRAGRLDDAERKLSRAYELDPSNPTTALNLSEVLYRRGEYERARFYIRRVNQREELTSSQTLWLAMRIENRMGNRGSVDEIGRQLQVSAIPIREALQFLQSEGLVLGAPHVGATVAPISEDEVQEVFTIMEGLESVGVREAARRLDDAGLALLSDVVAEMDVADHRRMTLVPAAQREAYAFTAAGAMAQNVYLYCASQGPSTVIRAWIDRHALGRAMDLGADQQVLLAQTVGYPRQASAGG